MPSGPSECGVHQPYASGSRFLAPFAALPDTEALGGRYGKNGSRSPAGPGGGPRPQWLARCDGIAAATRKIGLFPLHSCIVFDDGEIRVEAIATRHLPERNILPRSYAFLLHCHGKRILLSGDLSPDFSDFPLICGCDLAVSELTHFQPETAMEFLQRLPCHKLPFTHIHDPWDTDDGRKRFLAFSVRLPYPCEIAKDGNVYEI